MIHSIFVHFTHEDKLSQPKWLDGGVYFVDQTPLTPSGKVMRPKVKEMAQHFYESKKQMK